MEEQAEYIAGNKKVQEYAKKLAQAVQDKYDAFLATQLTLIAKEKGVSVYDLCMCSDSIEQVYQNGKDVIRYWIEIKPKFEDLCK